MSGAEAHRTEGKVSHWVPIVQPLCIPGAETLGTLGTQALWVPGADFLWVLGMETLWASEADIARVPRLAEGVWVWVRVGVWVCVRVRVRVWVWVWVWVDLFETFGTSGTQALWVLGLEVV